MPIQIDPSWFPVPQPAQAPEYDEWLPPGLVPPKPYLPPWEPPWVAAFEPTWEPPWEQAFAAQPRPPEPPGGYWEPLDPEDYLYPEDYPYECDPGAFAEDNPYWDWEAEQPEPEPHIHVYPDEKVPDTAGEFVQSYYLIGVGTVLVFERLHPDELDLHPDQIVEPSEPRRTPPPEPYWEAGDYPPENDPYEYECDPGSFAEDNPYWDDEPPEPEDDDIYVRPGERVPFDAGELLRTYYVVGEGDVRVFARIHPDDMDLHPDQIVEPSEPGELRRSFNIHFRPKGPKPPE